MGKYIDVEKLIAEITRIDNEHPVHISERYEDGVDDGYHGCCDEIVAVIESLQQEQPEVDIEKEIAEHAENMPHGEFTHESECIEHEEWAKREFHHFYELGLNTRKEK